MTSYVISTIPGGPQFGPSASPTRAILIDVNGTGGLFRWPMSLEAAEEVASRILAQVARTREVDAANAANAAAAANRPASE